MKPSIKEFNYKITKTSDNSYKLLKEGDSTSWGLIIVIINALESLLFEVGEDNNLAFETIEGLQQHLESLYLTMRKLIPYQNILCTTEINNV